MTSNGTAIAVEGWEELQQALQALADEVVVKVGNQAARAGANYLKGQIVAATPVGPGTAKLRRNKRGTLVVMDYGHLRDNIRVRAAGKKSREGMNAAGYFEFSIDPGAAFWGKFLEFGTAKMAARPIWRPTFDAEAQNTVDVVGKRLEMAISRASKRQG